METRDFIIIFIVLFVIVLYYKCLNKTTKFTKKLLADKIATPPIETPLTQGDVELDSDNYEVVGIYDAPMYMPVDNNDSNIFLLNQIKQKFNDTVAYVDQDLSKINN